MDDDALRGGSRDSALAMEVDMDPAAAPVATAAGAGKADAEVVKEEGGGKLFQDQIAQDVAESWETAYIFAFVNRFTDICTNIDTALKLQTAMDLEHAIEEPGTSDDPHPALQAILTVFRKNLRNPETRTTAKDWIQVWVKETLASKEKVSPTREILRWSTNKVAEAEDGFFGLHWRDKLHLLRTMIDHQLTNTQSIKERIQTSYDIGRDRPGKARTTEENPLIVESLGIDSDLKKWWQIDDSPRLYCSGNPYKKSCTWEVLSSNREEFDIVMDTLAKPEVAPDAGLAPIFQTKKKKSSREQFELELRKQIENAAIPRLEEGVARLAELQRRKDLAELNERRKQERVAQAEAQEVAAQEVRQSRGTRLRTQTKKPDYVTDGLTERQWAKAFQKMDRGEDVELPDEFPGGSSSRRGKRKRYEDDSEDFEMASDEDEEDAGRPQRSSRNRKAKAPAQPEWRGERRSSRVKAKPVEVEEESSEEEVIRPSVAWGRSRKPSEPQQRPAPEEEAGGNISVWSKGKLVYVQGNNRYSSKPIAAAPTQKRRTVANSSGGSVIRGDSKDPNGAESSVPPLSAGLPSASSHRSFADLRARLEAMQGADDSSSDGGSEHPREGVHSAAASASTSAPTNTISNGRTASSPIDRD